jgi:hypothetical protein
MSSAPQTIVISAEAHRVSFFRYQARLVIATTTGARSTKLGTETNRASAEREAIEMAIEAVRRARHRPDWDVVLLGLAEGLEK